MNAHHDVEINNDKSRSSETKPISVNYFITRTCNYKCGFCFHTAKNSFHLPIETAKQGLRLLQEAGTKKINFAGGEPFLLDDGAFLGELAKYCNTELDLESVSIISNGSRITEPWMRKYGKYVDIMAISVDSFSDETNQKIGRLEESVQAKGGLSHVEKMLAIRDWCLKYSIAFKVNTVVNYNWKEDMTANLRRLGPVRWKVFQCLLVQGQNTREVAERDAKEFLVSDQEFASFVKRHKGLDFMVPEDNNTMRDSDLLLDEELRFLECSEWMKIPTESILDVGVRKAFAKSGFNHQLFEKRGGECNWDKEKMNLPKYDKTLEKPSIRNLHFFPLLFYTLHFIPM